MCRNPTTRTQTCPNHKKRHQETACDQQKQRVHEENERGDADPRKYAKLTSADRDMRLLGYDIYRFGGAELKDRIASVQLVGCFFDSNQFVK